MADGEKKADQAAETRKREALRKAKDHTLKNTRKRNDRAQACIDGGTSPQQLSFDGEKSDLETSLMKRPGGSAGLSMILGKFGFSPEESFVHIRDFLKSKDITYSWHTDRHVHSEGQFDGKQEKNGTLAQNLDREHEEELILLVVSKLFTVNPLGADGKQAFVYDMYADDLLLADLADYLEAQSLTAQEEKKITKEHLIDTRNNQDSKTLGLLGSSKGKDIVKVTINDQGQAEYEYVAQAPVITDGHSSDHKCTGCGHCQAAIDNAEKYELSQGWVEELFKYISGELVAN